MRFSLFTFLMMFLLFPGIILAQQNYTINGETLTVTTEVEGPLTLLSLKEDRNFRFFSKKGNEIVELKDTKIDGKQKEEYKLILKEQTADAPVSVEHVRFTPRSLSKFFRDYNSKINPEYAQEQTLSQIQFRLGFFGGIDNVVYVRNEENTVHPIAGIDFELVDPNLRRHALLLQFKHTFSTDNHDYTTSQLLFNYRFKFVATSKFDAFVNFKFATLSYWKEKYEVIPANGPSPLLITNSAFGVGAPLSFGLGADYKLGNGYITFGFNDFAALNANSPHSFPINFSLGYKWML